MLEMIGGSAIVGAAVGAGVSYLWFKKSVTSKFAHLELEAKAKAKAIENEAELLLKAANVKIKENAIEQETAFHQRVSEVEERKRKLILQGKII